MSMSTATDQKIADLIDADENDRGKRVKGRGGKTYRKRTRAELAEARAEHEDRVTAALDALTTAEGMAAYLVADMIHKAEPTADEPEPKNLSPANLALAAYQAPGQIVAGYWQWLMRWGVRVGKGCKHDAKLTGGKNLPVANWSAEKVGYVMGDVPAPDMAYAAELAASWAEWPERTPTGLRAWVDATRPAFIEGQGTYKGAEPKQSDTLDGLFV
jgi:hypothetical protein